MNIRTYFFPCLLAIFAGVGFGMVFSQGVDQFTLAAREPLAMAGQTLRRVDWGRWPVATISVLEWEAPVREPVLPSPPPESPVLRLGFVGDIMLDRGVKHMVEKHGAGDYAWLFERLGGLKEVDILFGNLEGPISDRGADRGHLYSFRFLSEVAPILADAGFQVLSIANNHIGDWGHEAFLDTTRRLLAVGITPVGGGVDEIDVRRPRVVESSGIRVGYLAVTDVGPDWLVASGDSPGILLASHPELPEIVATASEEVDVLVVSFHFGDEYQKMPNHRQQLLARMAIDNGAKLVIGHHPHVVQPLEYYRDGLIAYSLGNFIFDQYFSAETMRGLFLTVSIKDGAIVNVREQSVILDDRYQPRLE